MSDQPNLVTTCTFKGKEYLVKMNIISGNSLEMSVTDKYTTEEWQCCYDANYIENITHKTGNFKQFDIFTTMLKSGLLKTSECVSLDLLTYDDLEMLRNRRMNGRNLCPSHSVHSNNVNATSNRRYLILTYSVEFDRIHYPLPMEYCGPPNPQVLQGIIHRLEGEVERLQEQLKKQAEQGPTNNTSHISKLQKRIEDLSAENKTLSEDVRYLNKALSKHSNSMHHIGMMKGIVNSLQEQVIKDRMISHRQIKRLQEEKAVLKQQVQVLRHSERQLRIQLKNSLRGRSPVHPAYVPISSQSAERLNPSLTSRHPGDGRGSPLKNTEYASQKLRCREVSRSPNWRRNLRENNNLHQVKPVVPTAQRIVSPSRTQNVCCLQPSSLRCCRSSSESSCGSRNHISSQCTIIRKVKHPDNVATQLAVSLQKQNNQDRGRPRQRTIFSKTRNTSGSSVESVNVRQLRENNSKKKAINCSRESSGGSTSSRCKVKRKESPGTGDHEVLRPNEPKCFQSSKDLKLGMSDLESRIQALQKLLKEGLSLKA